MATLDKPNLTEALSHICSRDENWGRNMLLMTFGRNYMVRTEQLAEAAESGDALLLRSLVQDWLLENTCLADCPAPVSTDRTLLSIAAGIVELLAQRQNEQAPIWTQSIGAVEPPVYLVRAAEHMPRLRQLCQTESPLPLRSRNIFATPTFLEFA